jgi:hypothetical protein
MEAVGVKPDSLGCEICKPAMGSILSSLWNEPVMSSSHHQNQDTNDKYWNYLYGSNVSDLTLDRYLANMQRNGCPPSTSLASFTHSQL